MSMVDSFEKIPVNIYPDLKQGSKSVAREIADLIRSKQAKSEKCILGLATGSTPKSLYAELVRLHKEEGLSFKNVVTFNLDEYYPIEKDALQSYNRFMHVQLFDQVDIDPANIHIPDGEVSKENIKAHCLKYEQLIEEAGGVDFESKPHAMSSGTRIFFVHDPDGYRIEFIERS
jgi:glucosamine-6-phosphate deaminase